MSVSVIAQMAVHFVTQVISGISFTTTHISYAITNKTEMSVGIEI